MERYLKERSGFQRKWYEKFATRNKKKFLCYQTTIIVLGAVIPVLVTMGNIYDCINPSHIGFTTAIISATISIIAALDKLHHPQPNWFNYRANEESIKKEEWFFQYMAGDYKSMSKPDAESLFIERIEGIISADITRVTNRQLEKKPNGDTPVIPTAEKKPAGEAPDVPEV